LPLADRELLMARLAAERARLLHTLVGLRRDDLTGPPVVADWTAATILAHIGDWDRFYAARIRLAVAGRSMEIEGIDNPDDRNPAVHERIKGMTLEKSIEEMEAARSEFLRLLIEQVDDKTLRRSQPVQWGKVTIRNWTAWRSRHDYNHTKDLRRWKKSLPSVQRGDPPMGPASLIRAAIKAACDDFLIMVRLVPDSERETRPLAGKWTLKDILGHVADGQIEALAHLRMLAGGLPPPPPVDEHTSQRNVEARASQPYMQVMQDFRKSYVALEGAAAKMSDADLAQSINERYPDAYACIHAPLEHMIEHAAGLRRELGLRVPARLREFHSIYTE